MNYIIVLNWNSENETINCVNSLLELKNFSDCRLIICDNNSSNSSYESIKSHLSSLKNNNFVELNEENIDNDNYNCNIVLIKNKENYGYAGGNNRGIQLALNDNDMENVWILNNDTVVQPDTLIEILNKKNTSDEYGIIGSRLVRLDDKHSVQGIGGLVHNYFFTTKEIGRQFNIEDEIDEDKFEKKIDYVIGASFFVTKDCLKKNGFLCEDYFLYYEEIDYCNRAKENGYKIGIASKSIVFHEQGVSTKLSDVADQCQVLNRIKLVKKFNKKRLLLVKVFTFLVILNRFRRREFKRGLNYLIYTLKS